MSKVDTGMKLNDEVDTALARLEAALELGKVKRVVLTYAERGPLDGRMYDKEGEELAYDVNDTTACAIMDDIEDAITVICANSIDVVYPAWRSCPRVEGLFLFVYAGGRFLATWQHTEQDVDACRAAVHVLKG